MKIGFERVRFVLWFVLVVVLLTAMFSVWRSMFSDMLHTALEMTRLQLINGQTLISKSGYCKGVLHSYR